jgi:glucosamine--fructose-6-phosphate aminotransferase (isomerizing)
VCDDVIKVPKTPELIAPIITNIPLQMLAYRTSIVLGRDIDKPRNLAKSVTVA